LALARQAASGVNRTPTEITMRSVLFVFLAAGLAVAQPAPTGIKPTAVTFEKANATLGEVAAELSKSPAGVLVGVESGLLKAKCPADFDSTPFWDALETAADRTRTRLALHDGGRNVTLEPAAARREISAVSGPFRMVARTVTGRLLVESGTAYHEIQLDVHWEPRVSVFRIDSNPKVTKAEDDRGKALTADHGMSRHFPTAALTDMKVRLAGLTRESKRIAVLAGEFRATAAERMLAIPFKTLAGKFPATQTAEGVKVVLKSFAKVAGFWEAELEMAYPEGHPNFESFEEQKWLRDTRLRLVGPDGKPFEPDNDDVIASGRNVAATYRFKLLSTMNPTGKDWSLVLETPGPLKEVTVPFTLKNIPLP
jgi:hypothetical protein